jgi:predicted DNA-binding transcriptional regulator YafY
MPFCVIFLAIPGAVTRLHRLERLRGLLAGESAWTAAQLAARLNVSARTLMRDLDVLRDEGVLIEADRGRGGGVRLARGHAAGRVRFTAPEAMGLLVSLALAEKLDAPLLGSSVKAARQKIAAAFARDDRDRIIALRRRILIGAPASLRVLASYGSVQADMEAARIAFFELRPLDIAYRDERGAQTTRTIEPHYLYLNPPAWYFLAWDRLRDGVRAFRFDRIASARVGAKSFRMRPATPFLAAAESGVEPV